MTLFHKSKKKSVKANDPMADTRDQAQKKQAAASADNACPNIAVATYESLFPEAMVSYTLEMAKRMGCGIIAVNCANLTHDVTDFFSNAHDVAFDEFKKNADRNAQDFRTKALSQGLTFAHVVHYSDIDTAIAAVIKEYAKPEYIITENPAGMARARTTSDQAPSTREDIHILLVDDNPRFLNALADRIRLQGHEPLTALTGKEALDIIQTKAVHLAIIDQRLPDMEGLDLIARLKEIDNTIPSSLLTGHGDEKLKEATEALESVYFEKEDMGSFWGFFRKILNSLASSEEKTPVIAQTFCVYAID
ncbi:MAG TPA: response regulator [Desulfotignum sp.]|nr:response regulator [Desulfotignum sp.]